MQQKKCSKKLIKYNNSGNIISRFDRIQNLKKLILPRRRRLSVSDVLDVGLADLSQRPDGVRHAGVHHQPPHQRLWKIN